MQATAYLQQFLKIGKVSETKKSLQAQDADPILLEIWEVTKKLENIKCRFDFEVDDDMIEACIYEERALLSRYSFLLTLAKQKGLCQSPLSRILSSKNLDA